MAELVDALVLGTSAFGRAGSSPVMSTHTSVVKLVDAPDLRSDGQ